MDKINNIFFSPLSKKYCVYFYWISVAMFIALVSMIITGIISLFVMGYKAKLSTILFNIFIVFLGYFQNRLLYSMCVV
jgi:hypothetical protein